MRRGLLFVVLGYILLFSSPVFAQVNLLTNPNFENGINSWTIFGPNWQPQSTVVKEGALSALNTIGTIPTLDYFASLSQEVTLAPSQQVYATVQLKTNINVRANARAGLLLQFMNSANAVLASVQDEDGGLADWRQLYVTAQAPAGTVKVKYSVFVFAPQSESQTGGIAVGGQTYFDEAVLTTAVIAPPQVPAFLSNPGFENGFANNWKRVLIPSWIVDDQNFTQGSFSVKSTIDLNLTPGQDFFSGASQDLRYLSGPVFASAQARTLINPASTGLAELKLEFYDRFNPAPTVQPLGSASRTLRGNNGWGRIVIDGTGSGVTPPVGTVMVRVLVLTYAAQGNTAANGGIANFDEVTLSYAPLPPNNRMDVLNRGFENGLNSWSEQFGFPATTSPTAHGGSLSAKKTVGVLQPAQDYYSQLFQDIYYNAQGTPWPVGTFVYASAFVKSNFSPLTKNIAGLQFEFIDAQGNVIRNAANQPIVVLDRIGGQTNWDYKYLRAQTPANTVRVRVSGMEFARRQDAPLAGDAWYDDFVFSKTTPLPLPAQRLQTVNAGFENGLRDGWDEPFEQGEITTTAPHSGNYAAEYTVRFVLPIDYFAVATQEIALQGNTLVRASGWVKTNIDPTTFAVGGIFVRFVDNSGAQVGNVLLQFVGGQINWTQLNINAAVPFGATKVQYYNFVYAPLGSRVGDKVYFDDSVLSVGVPIALPCLIGGNPC